MNIVLYLFQQYAEAKPVPNGDLYHEVRDANSWTHALNAMIVALEEKVDCGQVSRYNENVLLTFRRKNKL